MAKHILSKSTFIKGDQCLKQLYLYKKRNFLRDRMPQERIEKFRRGTNVGVLAQEIFPGGVDVKPKSPSQYQKSVVRTLEQIALGVKTIYEATFQFDDVLVMLDILHKDEDGWKGYEVKSSKFISETYVKDAALQYYVISNSEINLVDFHLIYINENYLFDGELNIQEFFTSKSVLNKCKVYIPYIEKKILEEIEVLTLDHSPKIPIGKHCFSPYDCDFIGHCWKKIYKNSIFDLVAASLDEKQNLFDKGIHQIIEIKKTEALLPLQKAQWHSLKSEKEYIDKDKIKSFLNVNIDYIFLDILFYRHAFPFFKNTKPYQSVPVIISSLDKDQNFNTHTFKENPLEMTKAFFTELLKSKKQIILYDQIQLEWIYGKSWQDFIPERNFTFIMDIFYSGSYFHPELKGRIDFNSIATNVLNKSAFEKSKISSDELALYTIYDLLNEKGDTEKISKNISIYAAQKLNVMHEFYDLILSKASK